MQKTKRHMAALMKEVKNAEGIYRKAAILLKKIVTNRRLA